MLVQRSGEAERGRRRMKSGGHGATVVRRERAEAEVGGKGGRRMRMQEQEPKGMGKGWKVSAAKDVRDCCAVLVLPSGTHDWCNCLSSGQRSSKCPQLSGWIGVYDPY